MLILLWSKGRPKFHINKLSLSYFYCNVQFCVGCGREILMYQHSSVWAVCLKTENLWSKPLVDKSSGFL
jgi:hypothetical protein